MPSNKSFKNRNYYIVFLILLIFFVISFLTNIIGPLVPDIIKGFDLNLTLVAILPLSFFIAYGVMSIPAGILNAKIKEKKVMILAFIVAFIGALLLVLYPNYLTALISLFLIGSGMALLQVVINPLLRISGGEENYAFNSVLAQLIFGSASFISPLVYSYMVVNLERNEATGNAILNYISSIIPPDLPWISMYFVFAVVCFIMVGIVLASKFPKVLLSKEEEVGTFQIHLELLKNPVVILYFLGIFCYVGTEQGIANWISQFLYEYHHFDPQTVGAKAVSYFWGLMTIGGLLGLLLLKFIDSRKVLISFTILAILCFCIGMISNGSVALWMFPLTGFFASVMYPIIISLALNSLSSHHGVLAGILLTGIIGGAIIPFIVGWLGDNFGLRQGMLFNLIALFYILSIGFWARPLIGNKTRKIVQ